MPRCLRNAVNLGIFMIFTCKYCCISVGKLLSVILGWVFIRNTSKSKLIMVVVSLQEASENNGDNFMSKCKKRSK